MPLKLNKFYPDASRIVLGGMGLSKHCSEADINLDTISYCSDLLASALECGINVIDLADIYGHGQCEQIMGELFKRERSLRHHLIVQTKVGIRLPPTVNTKHYDLSGDWITESVNASIKRMHDNPPDILFLHRPDPLMQLEDSANALMKLYEQEKFSYLAVSNMHAGQIAWLQSALQVPIIANQLEMSLLKHDFVTEGITTNMAQNSQNGFPRGTIEFCQQSGVQLQAWAPIAQGCLDKSFESNDPRIVDTQNLISKLCEEYKVEANTLVLAWLLKHPANIQPVIGTTVRERVIELCKAEKVELSREHWYAMLESIVGSEVP